ncbi:MAG TPA: OmpA family protein [Chthoniobacterales bacterium]|jgi:outer membrane protein OmpA-like peptidoglycan-associated protein
MAKPLPKEGTRLRRSVRGIDIAGKTPAGVWVIVGMALFFVIGGLGTGAFIAWKAITEKMPSPASDKAASQRAQVAPSVANASSAEVGVEHAKSIVEAGGPPAAAASDRVEQDQVRQDVLKRIDLMRGLSDTEKDKLYVQVQRARGFTKIGIIRFTQAGTTPSTAQTAELVTNLNEPGLRKLLADPTVILIMVGYADKQGEEAKNVEVSRSRAENVVKALREKTDLPNIMHAVGMGGQDIFDQSNLDKNRLVEVWAVQT